MHRPNFLRATRRTGPTNVQRLNKVSIGRVIGDPEAGFGWAYQPLFLEPGLTGFLLWTALA